MLALVRSGVGLSLARDSLAMRESQSEGLVIADRVGIDTTLTFICRNASLNDAVVRAPFDALARARGGDDPAAGAVHRPAQSG